MQMEVTLQAKNITIIGSGLMGHGIALKFAQYNCNVIVYDPNDVSLDSLFERIEISLSQMEIKKEEIIERLKSCKKYISQEVNKLVDLKFIPKLVFRNDETVDQLNNINNLLNSDKIIKDNNVD